jgi:hypothetical protein
MTRYRMNTVDGHVEVWEEVPSVFNDEDAQSVWEHQGGEGPRPHLMRVVETDDPRLVGTFGYWSKWALEDTGAFTVEET